MKSATGLKNINNETKKATSNLNKFQLVAKNLKSVLNFSGLVYGIRRVSGFLKETAENSIDLVETMNLFEVSMGKTVDEFGNLDSVSSKYYTKALKFQKELNERFGTNIEETMRYQALYNQMAQSMGIGDSASYTMSENLTKLGMDLASLFNREESDTMEALRAGVLAGQTKPLRNYGLDVTQQSLAPLLQELGLDRSISELSQAEKMILRYIAVLRQASSAHGDFANTIESPANQLKVFRSQFEELKTSIGNLFQGLLGQIMPYINGAIMAIKELLNLVGILFGFEVSSSNSNLADQSGIEDLETGLSGAVGSAKELKAQLMGFDEINNITTDTSSGGGSAGISSTGIDDKLLDAMSEYDNLMGNVRMKATEIKEKIMDWLGLTGDVEHDTQRVKEILDTIEIVLKTVVGTWLATKAIGVIGGIIDGLGNGGILGLTNKIQLAVAGIAISWGLAEIAAKEYAEYLRSGEVSDKDAWTKASVGSWAASGTTGGIIGGAIGSIIPGFGTAVGAAIGTAIGTGVGVANTEQSMYDGLSEYYFEELQKALSDGGVIDAGFASSLDVMFDPETEYSLEDYRKYVETVKNIWTSDEAKSVFHLDDEELEKAREAIEIFANLEYAGAQLFDNGGQKIENYYNKYKQLVEEIVSSSDEWNNLHNKYLENEQALEDTTETLDIFLTKLGNSAYETTAEDIAELNSILDEMRRIVKESGDAFVDSTISLTNSLKDEGYISTETADLVVANAIRKAEAEGEAFNTLQLKLKDYSTQLEKGMITQDEYNTLIAEARAEYEKTTAVVDTTKTAVEHLTNQIGAKIDFENWETAKKYTEDLGNLYTDNEVKLKGYYETKVEQINTAIAWAEKELEKTKEVHGEESEEYKEIQERLEALKETRTGVTKQYEDDVLDLKKTVYESLKIVEQQLIDSGYDIEKDSQGIYKSVQEQLNKIGLDTEIASNIDKELGLAEEKIANHQKGIAGKLSLITKNLDGTFSINMGLNIDYSTLKKKLQSAKSLMDTMSSNPILGTSFKKYSTNIQSLINQLNGYAEGGFPDMGEIFLAREAGPELVGKIGSRTAVANNSQIVEAVSRGVYEAVASAMPKASSVQLDIRADEGIIVKKAAQGFKEHVMQTGELPFPVPI